MVHGSFQYVIYFTLFTQHLHRKKSITTDDYKIKLNTVQIIKCVWWSKWQRLSKVKKIKVKTLLNLPVRVFQTQRTEANK